MPTDVDSMKRNTISMLASPKKVSKFRIDVTECGLLFRAEVIGNRVDTDTMDGGIELLKHFAILNIKSTNLDQIAFNRIVRGDKLSLDRC